MKQEREAAPLGLHQREVINIHEGYGEEAWCALCMKHWPCKAMSAKGSDE